MLPEHANQKSTIHKKGYVFFYSENIMKCSHGIKEKIGLQCVNQTIIVHVDDTFTPDRLLGGFDCGQCTQNLRSETSAIIWMSVFPHFQQLDRYHSQTW